MPGMFDDLIPAAPQGGGAFDDLIPPSKPQQPGFGDVMTKFVGPALAGTAIGSPMALMSDRVKGNIANEAKNAVTGIPSAIEGVMSNAANPNLLTRRNEYTDIPGSSEQVDPLVRDTTQLALGATVPAAGRLGQSGMLGEGGARVAPAPESLMPDRAARLIAKKLVEDKVSPQDMARQALEQANIGATGTAPLDLGGDSLARLAGTTYRTGKEAGQQIRSMLDDRAAGQVDRLSKSITENLADPSIAYSTAEDIYKKRQKSSQVAYAPAYNHPLNMQSPEYAQILSDLSTPAGQAAMRKAAEIISNKEGTAKASPFTVEKDGSVQFAKLPDTKTLHYVLQGFDDVIDANKVDAGFGRSKLTQVGSGVQDLKSRIRENLYTLNDPFKKAQNNYSSLSELRGAIDAGMDAINKPHEIVASEIAKLPDVAKEMYRLGFARAVQRSKLNTLGDATGDLLKPEFNKTMAAVFPNPATFEKINNHIASERRQAQLKNSTIGGSPTAQRVADDAGAGVNGAIDIGKMVLNRDALGLAGKAKDWVVRNHLGLNNQKLASDVAKMLTTRVSDPKAFAAVLRRIEDEYKRIKRP